MPEEDGSVVEAVIGGRIDEYGVLVDRYHYLAEQGLRAPAQLG